MLRETRALGSDTQLQPAFHPGDACGLDSIVSAQLTHHLGKVVADGAF
jgi:hypothetical protein